MNAGNSIAVDEKKINKVVETFKRGQKSALVHVLQKVQKEFNYLPPQSLRAAAKRLEVPLSKVYQVATFYRAFFLEPRGEKIIKVCLGTTCHIRGAGVVVDDLHAELGISPGETTGDMKYSIEVVNCVGACALAPVVISDEKYLADVKPGTVMKRLKKGK